MGFRVQGMSSQRDGAEACGDLFDFTAHMSRPCESIGVLLPIAVSKPGSMGKAPCCHNMTEVVITIFTAIRYTRNSARTVIG